MDKEMRRILQSIARGWHPTTGQRVSLAEQMAAVDRLNAAEAQDKQERLARDRMKAEMALAADKIEVQKAEVAVKALEVLATSGMQPEQLLEVVQGFTGKLLSGPTVLALEAKDD
jgi:hypothetical protein